MSNNFENGNISYFPIAASKNLTKTKLIRKNLKLYKHGKSTASRV